MSADALAPADFAAFFEGLHGVPPFPWQERLLHQIADTGNWPSVLDLPTGSGKTAALDIAVFHLALEAPRPAERRAPVRIAFVVDRRIIVDDAFTRARRIADGLRWALLDDRDVEKLKKQLVERKEADSVEQLDRVRSGPTVRHAALRLRVLAGADEPPLLARRLRGGVPREDDWARTPVQPTILCSTVDQVGSRLLFRGYGVTDRMKPVHAGLLGSDCLMLLDEAHLAEPFRQTLAGIDCLRGPDAAPWQTALLTATPWDRAEKRSERRFELNDDDRANRTLSARLTASKPAEFRDIPGRHGVPVEARRIDEIAARAETMLATLSGSIANPAIGVVVNRVARARGVFDLLKQKKAAAKREEALGSAAIVLVIGPARSVDRDDVSAVLDPIRTGSADAERRLEQPLIVVATQTIEAGVDIDLDGLITEAASLDALRQRFGRLNRAGRRIDARGAILAHRDDVALKADDPVYGGSAAKTWQAFQAAAGEAAVVDFGIEALLRVLPDDPAKLKQLVSPKPDAPVLMPAYADLLSQTSPVRRAGPDVALFLHGPDRSPASVQIIWRADLDEDDLARSEYVLEILRRLPPRASEAIEVPLWTARAWLRRQSDMLETLSDVPEREPDTALAGRDRRAFRYRGADDPASRRVFPHELRDGDVIIVPASYGGCDLWGWNPGSTEPVVDAAEAAMKPFDERRFVVRLTPALIWGELSKEPSMGDDGVPALDEPERARLTERLREILVENAEASVADLAQALDAAFALPPTMRKRLQAFAMTEKLRRPKAAQRFFYEDDAGERKGVMFVAPFGRKKEKGGDDRCEQDTGDRFGQGGDDRWAPPSTEDDNAGLAIGMPLLLNRHNDDVGRWASAFGERGGLVADVKNEVALSGRLHDLGKLDPRFQAYLAGGVLFLTARDVREETALAKSGRNSLPKMAWEHAGLPKDGWRHEVDSVRRAIDRPQFKEAKDPLLVLWLIGVHHGYGRPFFPHVDPDEPADKPGPHSPIFRFKHEGVEYDWRQIFETLKGKYGIWGLARLEAFVRLADHRASEEAQHRFADESESAEEKGA